MTAFFLSFIVAFAFAHDSSVGDEAFFRIDYPTAIAAYEHNVQSYPGDAEIFWRLARVYVCMGEVKDNDEAETLFLKAEAYARTCIRLDSSNAEGHTWLAAALGYSALNAGMKEQLRLTNELQAEIDKALALNPHNDAAYSIRGSLYRTLGNLGWLQRQLATLLLGSVPPGGFEEAEVALKHAIAYAPDVMRHHYELGVLYLDWDRTDEAKKELEIAVTLPVRVAIDRPRLAKIKQLLASLNNPR